MLDTVKNAPVNGLDLAALGEVVEAIEKDASQGHRRLRRHHPLDGPDPQRDHRRRLHAGRRAHQPQPQDRRRRAVRAARQRQRAEPAGAADGGVQRLHHGRLCRRRVAQGHQPRIRSRSAPAASSTCAASSASATPSRRATRTSTTKCRIKGDGSPEDFEEIHQTVMKTSPNYFNMSRPIKMNGIAPRRLTQHSAPRRRAWRQPAQKGS